MGGLTSLGGPVVSVTSISLGDGAAVAVGTDVGVVSRVMLGEVIPSATSVETSSSPSVK